MDNTIKAIPQLTSAVFDNKRRGEPLAGCDCMQCFGYCIIKADQQLRDYEMNASARADLPAGFRFA